MLANKETRASQPDSRITRLELGVGGELEGEPTKGQGEYALVVVVDAGVRGAEGLVDLLDGWGHLGAVEQDIAACIDRIVIS